MCTCTHSHLSFPSTHKLWEGGREGGPYQSNHPKPLKLFTTSKLKMEGMETRLRRNTFNQHPKTAHREFCLLLGTEPCVVNRPVSAAHTQLVASHRNCIDTVCHQLYYSGTGSKRILRIETDKSKRLLKIICQKLFHISGSWATESMRLLRSIQWNLKTQMKKQMTFLPLLPHLIQSN